MRLPSILLVGAGGHAQACIDVIEREGRFDIAGLVGVPDQLGARVLSYPVLGTDKDLPDLFRDIPYALVTAGQIKVSEPRRRLFALLERVGFSLPVVVSPHAYVSSHAALGTGSIVMHGAIINAAAVIGRNCILNSRSLVEHGATIADHCHIATGAVVNGDAKVGSGTFIGSGASVRESITIGKCCVVGMGQMVTADCPDGSRLPTASSTRRDAS